MTHRTDIQVRFADTDALGHLNNTAFSLYAELARLDFCRSLGMDVGSLILAHLSLDFRKQVRFNERVYVLTRVERLGSSSVTLQQTVYAGDEVAADIASVVVLFDYETQRPKRLSDELRARLKDL